MPFLFVVCGGNAIAQSEFNLNQTNLEQNLQNSIKANLSSFYPLVSDNNYDLQLKSLSLFTSGSEPDINYKPIQLNQNLLFLFGKSADFFPGLSRYEYYKMKLNYTGTENLSISVEGGLIKNQMANNPSYPAFQLGISAAVNYSLNDLLSLYAYGKYLSPALNKSAMSGAVPQLLIHPMFLNSETGAGIRLEYKNIESNIGLRTIYDTQFNYFKPVNTIGTKVKIGF